MQPSDFPRILGILELLELLELNLTFRRPGLSLNMNDYGLVGNYQQPLNLEKLRVKKWTFYSA